MAVTQDERGVHMHDVGVHDAGAASAMLNATQQVGASIGTAFTGYGAYSVDAVLGFDGRLNSMVTAIVLAVGIIGGFANAAIRRTPATK